MASYPVLSRSVANNNQIFTSKYDNAINEIPLSVFQDHIKKVLAIDPSYYKYNSNVSFQNCKIENAELATSVHKLRPQDIKVIGALGDSLTAALGAKAEWITEMRTENREISWSMGGEASLDTVVTLPNILRKFNPNLFGFSTESSSYFTTFTGVGLNAAVSGAKAGSMYEQARVLIQRMKESNNIDFEYDWKLVTLFIGGNDICDFCNDLKLYSPTQYIAGIERALDLLHEELPKTFVNLVSVLNVGVVENLNTGFFCQKFHSHVCPCAAYPENAAMRKILNEYIRDYSKKAEQLARSGLYDDKDDFTVVYQPFFRDFKAPRLVNGEIDWSYFAPDCFHFSSKSHAISGIGLWNNMLQPVGEKATTLVIDEPISCPTADHPYFYTNKNSRIKYQLNDKDCGNQVSNFIYEIILSYIF